MLSGGSTSVLQKDEGGNVSVKVFLFQNDENTLLADWLQYHSHLFGIENLNIVDNASSSPYVCKLLALYHMCGAVIVKHHDAFHLKHRSMTHLMREYKDKNKFLLPIDADEFIVMPVFDARGGVSDFAYNRSTILNVIRNLPVDGRKYKFLESKWIMFDRPVCEAMVHRANESELSYRRVLEAGGYACPTRYEPFEFKTFYHSDGFIGTDQGNHHGFVEHDEGHHGFNPLVVANLDHFFTRTPLVLFHFATPTYKGMKKKILRAAGSYNYTDSTNCSAVKSGTHYCEAAKWFRAGSAQSRDLFVKDCAYAGTGGVSIRSFREWFLNHTLSAAEILGEPVPLPRDWVSAEDKEKAKRKKRFGSAIFWT
jgi:hypothetical protein